MVEYRTCSHQWKGADRQTERGFAVAPGRRWAPTRATASRPRAIPTGDNDKEMVGQIMSMRAAFLEIPVGLVESTAGQIADPRDPNKVRYTTVELLRERIYALALGEENQDDLDRLAHDPAMKMAAWDQPGEAVLDQRLASQPLGGRRLRRHAVRPPLGQRLHSCDSAARTSSHGPRLAAFHAPRTTSSTPVVCGCTSSRACRPSGAGWPGESASFACHRSGRRPAGLAIATGFRPPLTPTWRMFPATDASLLSL